VSEREEAHAPVTPPRSRWRRSVGFVPDVLVIATVAFAFLAWHFDLGSRWGLVARDPQLEPALVLPPEGLDLPTQRAAAAVARPQVSSSASPSAVSRTIRKLLADRRLGPHVNVLVTDLETGKPLYRRGSGTVTPASTMKLLTSLAALEAFGPDHRFETTVRRVLGTKQIVLVGGGDPFLQSAPTKEYFYPHRADIQSLARRTATALRADGIRRVRMSYDDSLFTGPRTTTFWPSTYLPEGVAPPITALWVDEGRNPSGSGYVDDPSLVAGQAFRAALEKRGVTVVGDLGHRKAPSGTRRIAAVASPPLGQIVSRLVLVSDNNAAEVVAHHVGVEVRKSGSFAGGASAVRSVLGKLGVPLTGAVIHDGSGLSRGDRLAPRTLTEVLRMAASPDHPALREVVTGLPVAGFSGSLEFRFDTGATAGRGRVQAKTGTLQGVHGLAGVATDLDGNVMGFMAIADRVPPLQQEYARLTIDKVAAALGACRCGAGT
jgi:D-alanyl-D-alanine carboxypeptidase/D-alanyl-D-alanine-endopeptidase (penicillin-binding protein 4)